MAEFDLLSHLNVAVPAAPAAPIAPRATGASMVLAPRQKPPRPSSALTPAQSQPRAPRVMVLDAPVPCNDCFNQNAAEVRRRQREERKAQERFLAAHERPFAEDTSRRAGPAEKAALRADLEAAAEERRIRKSIEKREDRTDSRNQLDFLERAAAEEAQQREAKRAAAAKLREELRARAEQAREQRRSASQAHRDAAAAGESDFGGLRIGEVDPAQKRAAARSRSVDMVEAWHKQMSDRHERREAERRRDALFAAEASAMAFEREAQHQQARAATRVDASRELERLAAQRQADAERRAREKQAERENAAAERAAAAARDEADRTAKREKQQRLRAEIGHMIEQRRAVTQRRRHDERSVDRQRALLQADPVFERKVMYRCPATGRVLPPSAFNIPRNAWNQPNTAAVLL